jgi:hypothetical protein
MKIKNQTSSEWKEHEDHVASIYRALGYNVVSDINIDGKQTDLICEKHIRGVDKTVLYIDCKHTYKNQSSISNADVEAFIASFRARKDTHGWTYGVLVSNKPFSQFAKATAKPHKDIVLKTISDLEDDLLNVRHYLYTMIRYITEEAQISNYIPIQATPIDQNNQPVGKESGLFEYAKSWLADGNQQLCILGDFGSGKTTFLRFLFDKMASLYLSGKEKRIPLFIPLRDYQEIKDGKDLMMQFFSKELDANIPEKYLENLLKAGKFLILLDGFDEMGRFSDYDKRQHNYFKLSQLAVEKSKVIISCRPAYFITHKELVNTFSQLREQSGIAKPPTYGVRKIKESSGLLASHLQTELYGKKLEDIIEAVSDITKNTKIRHLSLFNEKQIQSYLIKNDAIIKRSSDYTLDHKGLHKRIKEIYDLEDLAKRPILLKLIVDSLPRFKGEHTDYCTQIAGKSYKFDKITPSILYFVYTESELAREYEKGDVDIKINRNGKREFIALLAYQMFKDGIMVIDHAQFINLIKSKFSPSNVELEKFFTDIRTCSFISRDKYDCFRFVHKSFLEYFAALHLLPELKTIKKASDSLSQRIIPTEILYFLGDMIPSFSETSIRFLNELFSRQPDNDTELNIIKHNILNTLNYARAPHGLIEGANVGNLYYQKLQIRDLTINKSHIGDIYCTRSQVKEFKFMNSNTDSIIFDSAKIGSLHIEGVKIKKINYHNTTSNINITASELDDFTGSSSKISGGIIDNTFINFGIWESSEIINLTFRKCIISSNNKTHIKHITTSNLIFEDCIFIYIDCGGDFYRCADFRKCIFIGCTLDENEKIQTFHGSKGYFIHEDNKKGILEKKDFPMLWNKNKIDNIQGKFTSISDIKGKDEIDKKEKIISTLNKLSWEEMLLIAFHAHGYRYSTLNQNEIQGKLKRIDENRYSFVHI